VSSVTIDGDGLKLSDYRGKYVLLDFWSTSCGPCLKDLPEMRRLYNELPTRTTTTMTVESSTS